MMLGTIDFNKYHLVAVRVLPTEPCEALCIFFLASMSCRDERYWSSAITAERRCTDRRARLTIT